MNATAPALKSNAVSFNHQLKKSGTTSDAAPAGLWEYVIRKSVVVPPVVVQPPNNENSSTFDVPSPSTSKAAVQPPAALAKSSHIGPPVHHHLEHKHQHHPRKNKHLQHLHDVRPVNSGDSIGNEMTHFKPIRVMPISEHQPNGGGASGRSGAANNSGAGAAESHAVDGAGGTHSISVLAPTVVRILHAPVVRYVEVGDDKVFSPAKSKFKPESPQKLRKSAFCLVPRSQPNSSTSQAAHTNKKPELKPSAVSKEVTLPNPTEFGSATNDVVSPPPAKKPNTRHSTGTNGSTNGSAAKSRSSKRPPAVAVEPATADHPSASNQTAIQPMSVAVAAATEPSHPAELPPPPTPNDQPPPPTSTLSSSERKQMREQRRQIAAQERFDFELAKKLQQFDSEPRTMRAHRSTTVTAPVAKVRDYRVAAKRRPLFDPRANRSTSSGRNAGAATKRKHSSLPTATTTTAAAAAASAVIAPSGNSPMCVVEDNNATTAAPKGRKSNRQSTKSSPPQRYSLRTRGSGLNESSNGNASDTLNGHANSAGAAESAAPDTTANGRGGGPARQKLTATGRRKR